MIIKNAYYPKQLPTQIVLELTDGKFYAAELTPFRRVTKDELRPLAIFTPDMGDEIPGYTLKLYGLQREASCNKLKELRQHLGLTQQQLADAAGINKRQLQKIESGEIKMGNITLANALALAQALGVDAAELMD